jgi:UDP-2,3-diacylglucosamine pyrophosphatase LpxH
MNITRHNPASITLEIASASTQHQPVMLTSDVHFDATICDLDLFTKHLKLAEEKQAPVIIAGDFFDAMQGHDDPRRSIEELKEKYRVSSYFDAIVQDASVYLRKFKVPYYILCLGNHETSVLRKINTNLIERLAYDLRLHNQPAESMGYWGYIRFMFNYRKGNAKVSKILYFHHGKSTGAVVTKGVIQVNRQGVYLNDVDFVLNGHNHNSYLMPLQVERINQRTMEPYTQTVWYMRTPGYKKSPGDSMQVWGYGAERHRTPTPRGCMFLEMTYSHPTETVTAEVMQKIC